MPLDTVACLDMLFAACRKTRAAETFAVFTEGRAGNDHHFFRLQQTGGEIFFAIGARALAGTMQWDRRRACPHLEKAPA